MATTKTRRARDIDAAKATEKYVNSLRLSGAKCGNCVHYSLAHSVGGICLLKSDFYGDVKVKQKHICSMHERKSALPAPPPPQETK